jgi:hypothetical protein
VVRGDSILSGTDEHDRTRKRLAFDFGL